jgi:hypothetical protein
VRETTKPPRAAKERTMTARRNSYRDDPAWLFTLRIGGASEPAIVIRAFELTDHPDKTRDHITVEVVQGWRLIFARGQLWVGSPVRGFRDGMDGREARAAVLDMVGMVPGDTDAEYLVENGRSSCMVAFGTGIRVA